jgi:Raf kinase inhibitor-like YbhB/YbcL family protein
MKKLLLLLALGTAWLYAEGFTLSSDVQGQLGKKQEFNGFGCNGQNVSPKLTWKNPPKGTKSFAVTVYDPDAPTGSGWWHWVVFDIPKSTRELQEGFGNKMHKGIIQSMTDFGTKGFGGACPPVGDKMHKYEFTVYALDVEKLGLKEDAGRAVVGYYLNGHTLGKATVSMYYQR